MNSDAYQDVKWAKERDSWAEFCDRAIAQQTTPRKTAMLGNMGSMAGSMTFDSYRFIYPAISKSCLYCKSSHGKERCPNCGASEYE